MGHLSDQTFKDKTAIAGIGYTPFMKNSEKTPLSMAAIACLNAVKDAGLSVKDIDGLTQFGANDSPPAADVGMVLGVKETRWMLDFHGGAWTLSAMIGNAAMAIATGQ